MNTTTTLTRFAAALAAAAVTVTLSQAGDLDLAGRRPGSPGTGVVEAGLRGPVIHKGSRVTGRWSCPRPAWCWQRRSARNDGPPPR